MPRSGCRKGFTLTEVALAAVVASSLMATLIYTSNELRVAADTARNEAFLQTVARDLGDNVDQVMPLALDQFTDTPGTIWLSMDKYSPANTSGLLAQRRDLVFGSLGLGLDAIQVALATPTPTPTAAPTATPTPAPTATPPANPGANATPWPAPAAMQPPSKPAYTANASSNDATLTMGNWRMRYEDGADGGKLMYTNAAGAWQPMGTLGTRGLVAQASMAFGSWQPPEDSRQGSLGFLIPSAVKSNLLRVTTKLGVGSAVPYYQQQVWAPRATTWSWTTTSIAGGPTPPAPWTSSSPPPNYFPNGGLFPVAVNRPNIIALGAVPNVTAVDVWGNPAPGNFGWVSWNDDNNTPYLDAELTNMDTQAFVDHLINGNTRVKVGSGVSGLPGNKTPGHSIVDGMAASHKVVTAFVYDSVSGNGSNSVYGVTGFAKFELTQTGMNGATGSDYLKFLGWADADGNLLPPGFKP